MSEETQTKLVITTTQVSVHREDSSPVFCGVSVRLADEGGGPFLEINDQDGQQIKLDFDEFEHVVTAVELLRGQDAVNE